MYLCLQINRCLNIVSTQQGVDPAAADSWAGQFAAYGYRRKPSQKLIQHLVLWPLSQILEWQIAPAWNHLIFLISLTPFCNFSFSLHSSLHFPHPLCVFPSFPHLVVLSLRLVWAWPGGVGVGRHGLSSHPPSAWHAAAAGWRSTGRPRQRHYRARDQGV